MDAMSGGKGELSLMAGKGYHHFGIWPNGSSLKMISEEERTPT